MMAHIDIESVREGGMVGAVIWALFFIVQRAC